MTVIPRRPYMTIKEIFKELDKRIGKDKIISYSEVKQISGLSDERFSNAYCKWENFTDWKQNQRGFPPDGTYEEALLGIL